MDQLADAAFGTPSGPPRPKDLSKNLSGGPGPTLTHPPEVPAPTSSPKVVHFCSGSPKAEASKPSDKKSVEDKVASIFVLIFTSNLFYYFNFF